MSIHSAVTPTDAELDARITRWGGWRKYVADLSELAEHRAAARRRLAGRRWWEPLFDPPAHAQTAPTPGEVDA